MKEYIVQAIAQETIDSFDAHNAPELIRCKDCKNACIYDDEGVICTHIDINGNDKHQADWFCADGERRTDDA